MSGMQRSMIPWTRDEVERLIAWMEEHPAALKGKQLAWHKDVKEQVFSNEEHITVKKITDKAMNMKKAWKEAKATQKRSGWGNKPEDNEQSINDVLERKCAFFWRLDEIWGSHPNATVIVGKKSSTSLPASLAASLPPALHPSGIRPASLRPAPLPPASHPPASLRPASLRPAPLPPASLPPASHPPAALPASLPASNSRSSTPDSDAEFDSPPSSPRATPAPPALSALAPRSAPMSTKRDKQDVFRSMKRMFEEKQASKEKEVAKRLKVEMDLQRERIKAEKDIAERRIEAEIRTAERVAQILADAQVKQMESFARVMGQMLYALRPPSAPSSTPNSGT